MTAPQHPQKRGCHTCRFKSIPPSFSGETYLYSCDACELMLTASDVQVITKIGCASHSSSPAAAPVPCDNVRCAEHGNDCRNCNNTAPVIDISEPIWKCVICGAVTAKPHEHKYQEVLKQARQQAAAEEREKVLDEIIKISMMIEENETERWETIGRPKNDGYINGSHSGFGHALRELRHMIDMVKRAESLRREGEQHER